MPAPTGKDLDFAYHQITVRDGKGGQDRVTMLPRAIEVPLQRHLARVQLLHKADLLEGYGAVCLPYAFDRKDPSAGKSWLWQYVFPASKRSIDPRSGVERRHHVAATVLQKAIKDAIRRAGMQKRGSCHTLRHNPAYRLMLSSIAKGGGSLARRLILHHIIRGFSGRLTGRHPADNGQLCRSLASFYRAPAV